MAIKTAALIGATGTLGSAILPALKQHFEVTVITRNSSQAKFDSDVRVVRVADDYPIDEVTAALRGQDAVISTISHLATPKQIEIARAAHEAGVKRFLPSEFGLDKSAVTKIPAIEGKIQVLKYLEELSRAESGFSWTAVVTGIFFDWGIRTKFLRFDLDKKYALILGDGNTKFSATSLPDIGLAVVKILQREEETRNKTLLTQTVYTNQNEILKALESETKSRWTVEHISEADFLGKSEAMIKEGDFEGIRNQVATFGMLHSQYVDRAEFANDILGLQTSTVEAEIARIVKTVA